MEKKKTKMGDGRKATYTTKRTQRTLATRPRLAVGMAVSSLSTYGGDGSAAAAAPATEDFSATKDAGV
jgi:hypothetical protein